MIDAAGIDQMNDHLRHQQWVQVDSDRTATWTAHHFESLS
jgi:hypothetical protein